MMTAEQRAEAIACKAAAEIIAEELKLAKSRILERTKESVHISDAFLEEMGEDIEPLDILIIKLDSFIKNMGLYLEGKLTEEEMDMLVGP